ncbi:MAG: DUF3798 domain-containing protein [Firmicutes bacterium]|nr:DUF3798 domain-containing protein [Bacillota bacterium]
MTNVKRFIGVFLLAGLLVGVAGCGGGAGGGQVSQDYKIGLATTTVTQNEDEYRAAEAVKAKYGDRVVHVTYPDNFMQEQETTIGQIAGLADDPKVKAIIVAQGVPGTAAAIDRIRQKRKDIVITVVEAHEDPKIVSEKADLVFQADDLARGKTIIKMAKQLGAKKFIHYSFPRHMAMELLAKRRDLMKEACAAEGIEFVFVTAPDPMGPDGIPGAQKFILENVPMQVQQHGKDICLFSTNCGMQEPLIKATLASGGIFAEQCCPSPTHGYPGALGIDVKGMAGNFPAILKATEEKIVEKGGAGRFATWPAPYNYVAVKAAAELSMGAIEGKLKLSDLDAVKKALEKESGVSIQVSRYIEGRNMYLGIENSYIFGKK